MAEIAAAYRVHPNQISKWKKQALDELPKIFSGRYEKRESQGKELVDQLYQKIGQLMVELVCRKRKLGFSGERLSLSDSRHKKYPCLLKGLTIDRLDQVWGTDITYLREIILLS